MSADTDKQIRVRNVTRSFREGERRNEVLKGLDLAVGAGETIALRGRSGSGKSTLLNLISGIDLPDSGEVIVAGQRITSMPERERTLFRRRHIGFVYQAFNLVPTLSVGDNVRLVLELNDISGREADDRVADLLQRVGLADRIDSYPDILSGGEQQRVAIARALCHDPAVVLADEPTGNLDDETASGVLDLLDKLVRQAGGTMIIATDLSDPASALPLRVHQPSTAEHPARWAAGRSTAPRQR